MKSFSIRLRPSACVPTLVVVFAYACSSAQAAPLTWTGTTSSALATTTNWSTNTAPANGDTLTFNGTDATTNGANALSMANAVVGGTTGVTAITVTSGQTNPLEFTGTGTTAGFRMDDTSTFTVDAGSCR